MRPTLVLTLTALSLLAGPSILSAQSDRESDTEWLERCRQGGGYNDDDRRGRACEVRNVPVRLSGRAISVDGGQNGGIRVFAWNGDSVRVTARMQAQDRTDEGARSLLSRIRFETDGRRVRTDGPDMDGRGSWSVSYVVYVPRRFDLDLDANNGGLAVTGVTGKLELRTTNGSVLLQEVGGDVHARTQNGSLNLQLAGARWDGSGLDAETQNGSVRLAVPETYAAQLETGTVNGSIRTDIPVTMQGRISRRLNIPLGGGGPPIRALTTNGSVTITRR
jgi:hypothetical protein